MCFFRINFKILFTSVVTPETRPPSYGLDFLSAITRLLWRETARVHMGCESLTDLQLETHYHRRLYYVVLTPPPDVFTLCGRYVGGLSNSVASLRSWYNRAVSTRCR